MRYFIMMVVTVLVCTTSVGAQSVDPNKNGFQLTEAQIKLLEQANLPKDIHALIGGSVCLKFIDSPNVSCSSVTNVELKEHVVTVLYIELTTITLHAKTIHYLYYIDMRPTRYGRNGWFTLAGDANGFENYEVLVNFKIR